MVVVILIGILTMLAIPSMGEARYNARSMDDATQIAELFREARTRAIGRGAAQLVQISATGGTSFPGTGTSIDLGTFKLYEAQAGAAGTGTAVADGGNTGLALPGGSPLSSCGAPATSWSAAVTAADLSNPALIDVFTMTRLAEQNAQIWSSFSDQITASPVKGSICFTPLGRTYYNQATPSFTPGVNVLLGELQIAVYRSNLSTGAANGLTRTVIIPNSGATRIVSK